MPNNKVLSVKHFTKLVSLFDRAAQDFAMRGSMRPDDAKDVSKKYYQLKDALTNYVIKKVTMMSNSKKLADGYVREFFVDRTLAKDECFGQWVVPAGTVVREKESTNFLFTVLPDGCKDIRGFVIPKRIFKR